MAHECTQKTIIDELTRQTQRQNRALFGNPDDPNDLGAIELIKEIHATQLKMIPTYEDINSWTTFFKKGKEVGLGMALVATTAGIIFGSIFAIKEWIKRP